MSQSSQVLIQKRFKTGGTQLFQPIIPYVHFRSTDGTKPDCTKLYDNAYVRANCMDFASGKGLICRRTRNELVVYPDTPTKDWIPRQRFSRGEVDHQLGVLAGEFLDEICAAHPSFDSMSTTERDMRMAGITSARRLHKTILDHFRNQKDMYY